MPPPTSSFAFKGKQVATPQSDKALKQLIDDYGDSMAYQIAEIRACRGEADAAFPLSVHAALERCPRKMF